VCNLTIGGLHPPRPQPIARNKRSGTKADAIRRDIAEHLAAKTREVIEGLSSEGVKVLANHVYPFTGKTKAKR
jgi:hypothetical protein